MVAECFSLRLGANLMAFYARVRTSTGPDSALQLKWPYRLEHPLIASFPQLALLPCLNNIKPLESTQEAAPWRLLCDQISGGFTQGDPLNAITQALRDLNVHLVQ